MATITSPDSQLDSVFPPERHGLLRMQAIWRERRFIVRAGALGLVLGLVTSFLVPYRYESVAQLMPPDSQQSPAMAMLSSAASSLGGGAAGIANSLPIDLNIKSTGGLFVGVLRSATVQYQLVKQFDLQKVYGERNLSDARKKLDEKTEITEDKKSGLINITVSDRDPQRAAAIAKAYVEQLDTAVVKNSTSAAHRERVFLEDRLNTVKHDLDAAENKLAKFSSANNAIDIKEQGRAVVGATAAIVGQIIAANMELTALQQSFTDNNVRVKAVKAQIAQLRKQLREATGKDYVDSEDPAHPESSIYSIARLPDIGVKFTDLYRETKTQETVYEVLMRQYESARVQEAKEIPSVKVLDMPFPPDKPAFPHHIQMTFLAGILFMLFAAGYVVAAAAWSAVDVHDPRKVLVQEIFDSATDTLRLRRFIEKRNRQVQDDRRNPKVMRDF